ncbi:hypothetical protein ScPMuIL_002852 [Solemya velum]
MQDYKQALQKIREAHQAETQRAAEAKRLAERAEGGTPGSENSRRGASRSPEKVVGTANAGGPEIPGFSEPTQTDDRTWNTGGSVRLTVPGQTCSDDKKHNKCKQVTEPDVIIIGETPPRLGKSPASGVVPQQMYKFVSLAGGRQVPSQLLIRPLLTVPPQQQQQVLIQQGQRQSAIPVQPVQPRRIEPNQNLQVLSRPKYGGLGVIDQSQIKKKPRKQTFETTDESGNWVPLDEYYYGKMEGNPSYSEEKGEYRFKCWYCSKMLYNNVRAMMHIVGHITSGKQQNIDLSDLTQCKYCYKQFDTPFEMQTHMEKVHMNNANVLLCRICEKDHQNRNALAQHMRQNHNACEMPYICHLCNFRSSMYSDVVDHFKKKHDSSQNLLCLYCLRVFHVKFVQQGWGQTQTFYSHLLKHQSKSSTKKCPSCKLTFFNINEVKAHKKDHFPNQKGVFGKNASCLNSTQVMIKVPESGLHNKAQHVKSLNAPTVNKIQDFGGMKMPKVDSCLQCFECKTFMGTQDHYKKHIQCSLCRFATSCSFAYANHMMGFHSGQMSSLNLNIPWERAMAAPMYCLCGYGSKYGNKIATHLVYCTKRTCYKDRMKTQTNEGSESTDSQEKPEASLLDVLGLVKKKSIVSSNSLCQGDGPPKSYPAEHTATSVTESSQRGSRRQKRPSLRIMWQSDKRRRTRQTDDDDTVDISEFGPCPEDNTQDNTKSDSLAKTEGSRDGQEVDAMINKDVTLKEEDIADTTQKSKEEPTGPGDQCVDETEDDSIPLANFTKIKEKDAKVEKTLDRDTEKSLELVDKDIDLGATKHCIPTNLGEGKVEGIKKSGDEDDTKLNSQVDESSSGTDLVNAANPSSASNDNLSPDNIELTDKAEKVAAIPPPKMDSTDETKPMPLSEQLPEETEVAVSDKKDVNSEAVERTNVDKDAEEGESTTAATREETMLVDKTSDVSVVDEVVEESLTDKILDGNRDSLAERSNDEKEDVTSGEIVNDEKGDITSGEIMNDEKGDVTSGEIINDEKGDERSIISADTISDENKLESHEKSVDEHSDTDIVKASDSDPICKETPVDIEMSEVSANNPTEEQTNKKIEKPDETISSPEETADNNHSREDGHVSNIPHDSETDPQKETSPESKDDNILCNTSIDIDNENEGEVIDSAHQDGVAKDEDDNSYTKIVEKEVLDSPADVRTQHEDGNEPLSENTDGNEPLSENTDGNEPLSENTDRNEPFSEKTDGNEPLSENTDGNEPLSENTNGNEPLSENTDRNEPPSEHTENTENDDSLLGISDSSEKTTQNTEIVSEPKEDNVCEHHPKDNISEKNDFVSEQERVEKADSSRVSVSEQEQFETADSSRVSVSEQEQFEKADSSRVSEKNLTHTEELDSEVSEQLNASENVSSNTGEHQKLSNSPVSDPTASPSEEMEDQSVLQEQKQSVCDKLGTQSDSNRKIEDRTPAVVSEKEVSRPVAPPMPKSDGTPNRKEDKRGSHDNRTPDGSSHDRHQQDYRGYDRNRPRDHDRDRSREHGYRDRSGDRDRYHGRHDRYDDRSRHDHDRDHQQYRNQGHHHQSYHGNHREYDRHKEDNNSHNRGRHWDRGYNRDNRNYGNRGYGNRGNYRGGYY